MVSSVNSGTFVGIRDLLIEAADYHDLRMVPWLWSDRCSVGVRENSDLEKLGVEGLQKLLREYGTGITVPRYERTLRDMVYEQVVPDFYVRSRMSVHHYKDLITRNKLFTVPVFLERSPRKQANVCDVFLPEDLVATLHKHRARIDFMIPTEGDIYLPEDYKWFEDFSQKFRLDRKNCRLITANLCESYTGTNFTVFRHNYFEEYPWFLKSQHKISKKPGGPVPFLDYSAKRRFISLNRVLRPSRVAVSTYLRSKYGKDSYVSLGKGTAFSDKYYLERTVNTCLGYDPSLKQRVEILGGIGNLLCTLDDSDINMVTNHAFDICPFQKKAMIAVITETIYDQENTVFFSEKIFKPIYCMQPFVLVSTSGSLKKLKEIGYRTFSKYWSEEYDSVENPQKRIESIYRTLDQIASKTVDEMYRDYLDMRKILEHNYRLFISRIHKSYFNN